jgi:hypothetical protein
VCVCVYERKFHLLISTEPTDDLKHRDHQDIMN